MNPKPVIEQKREEYIQKIIFLQGKASQWGYSRVIDKKYPEHMDYRPWL